MKKDKLLALLLTGSMVVLSGCVGGTNPGNTQTTESASEIRESEVQTETEKSTETAAEASSVFRFTRENFPVMDGSTSLAPLGEALASVLLGEDRDSVSDLVSFNRTTQSFRNLAEGYCNLVLASEPNPEVFKEMEEAGFTCDMETICKEGLVFVVNEDNPVDNLTSEQLRDIYSGKITNWKEVGGKDEKIEPFVRNEGAGSQVLMEKLVMGDTEIADFGADYEISSMGGLIEAVKSFDNSASAIGFTVFYYASDMEMAGDLKLLKIDDVEPSDETIRDGSYPFINDNYCAISADEPADSPARILYDWIVTEDGQKLLAEEGYVSIIEVE